jgi:hypothetical protein
VTWYRAVVDRVITRDELFDRSLKYPMFVVTFSEYGNTETVALGEMDALEGKWKDDQPGGTARTSSCTHGGGRGHQSPNDMDLYEEVRRRERESVTADKGWARRPQTTKSMLSQQQHRGHTIQDELQEGLKPTLSTGGAAVEAVLSSSEPKKRSADERAAVAEKKRKLMAKYG